MERSIFYESKRKERESVWSPLDCLRYCTSDTNFVRHV